jgi:predicted dehydrogenase
MCLTFRENRSAIVQSSWLDPRKVREMTIVGSRRMIVYDDVAQLEKIKVFDMRVETPPHYDTFADFHYAYHYGDMYVPYLKQEEPLKIECQHFLDCINKHQIPLSSGRQGLELVRILEASSQSLKQQGAAVGLQVRGSSKEGRAVVANGEAETNGAGDGKSTPKPGNRARV